MPGLSDAWPTLPLEAWRDTRATLHLWTQIVGKMRLVQSPWVNHSWHATLYVTAKGLTTGPIPYGNRIFQIDFDFIDHKLTVRSNDGFSGLVVLQPQSVATFYASLMVEMRKLGLHVNIHRLPNEVPDPLPFDEDETHHAYDREYVNRFWRILVQADRVFKVFRAPFLGKCSPVHFFWGSFDLAVTRFSGERAPERPGADTITREAYSHAVISHGFWPGSGPVQEPAFYAYAAPEPEGLKQAVVRPSAAYYHADLSEFILPYDAVLAGASPADELTSFLESTYDAAATLAGWNRSALERSQTT